MCFRNLKKTFFITLGLIICTSLYAQANITVDMGDDIYTFLTNAEERGYCGHLPYNKPYTVNFIKETLLEIKDYIESSEDYKFKQNELDVVNFYLTRYEKSSEGFNLSKLGYRAENNNEDFPMSFEYTTTEEAIVSSGFYDNKDLNSTGFEFFNNLNFFGDIGKNVSYRTSAFVGLTEMPLQLVAEDYLIGYWWYDGWKKDPEKNIPRTIRTFRNNSVLPYSYKKKWDGSIYYLTNLSSNGLEGWPVEPSIGLGMIGELRGNFNNGKITVGVSRLNREWGGMDNGSSLVYNYNTQPFVAFDAGIKLFDWLSFQTLTGVLEFPNAGYINENAWYRVTTDETGQVIKDESYDVVDGYFFQNAYSIGMFNLDLKYVHFDFGSTCIWPKRFELGYMFPLVDKVIYQNNVGDYDNLALFANIKGKLSGIGSLWGSLYLEEINSLKPNMFEKTRCMFAYQFGTKVNIPFLPFTTISARYTKLEPYCYTYLAFKNQPYYANYITEPYANNGRPIGYYLDPNSDELLIRIESMPIPAASFGFQYQMIRHGADYGSAQVPGSSIWSELPIGNRNIYYKYFLHDGAYEWTHVVKLDGSYNFKGLHFPFKLNASVGFIYDYFTISEVVGARENNYFANTKTPYHKIDNDEYPSKKGFVLSIGIKIFESDICQ